MLFILAMFAAFPAFADDTDNHRVPPVIGGLRQTEKDPCLSKDMKDRLQGTYVIQGWKTGDDSTRVEYDGTADARLDECSLVVKRCVGDKIQTGEMIKVMGLADANPIWKIEMNPQFGEKMEYYFQVTTGPEENPSLTAIDGGVHEDWRYTGDEDISCP